MGETDFSKEIEQYKRAILKACAGAYLHNLGKVSQKFNKHMADPNDPRHLFDYQHFIGLLLNDLNKMEKEIELYYRATKKGKTKRKKLIPENFAERVNQDAEVFKDLVEIIKQNLPLLPDPFNDCCYRMGDFIEYLGQGSRWARLYFRKDADKQEQHREILAGIAKAAADPADHIYYIEQIRGTSSLLTHLMNRCHHGASGGEKDAFYICDQDKNNCAFMATPFGFEIKNADKDFSEYDTHRKNAEEKIKQHLSSDNDSFKLNAFINALKPTFQESMADSQRPFNNISVYDIGHSGMALLKSAIWSLRDKKLTHDSFWTDEEDWLRWRLLRFSLDGLGYLSEAVSIADLRVRKKKLDEYLDGVKSLLDEQYPVATEVYRDENGSIFVFPDWEENSAEAKSIKQLIDKTCGFNSGNSSEYPLAEMYGIEPSRQISPERCMAHPGDARKADATYIGEIMQNMILKPLSARPVLEVFNLKKKEKPQEDLCPYCGLRLISKQVKARKTCQVCLNERGGIAKNWWNNEQQRTIWLEEIADDNGRLALVTGRFFPECFIALDYFPAGKQKEKGRIDNKIFGDKMYSAEAFARQRRIWETCREFWQSIEKDIIELVGSGNSRLRITVQKIDQSSKEPASLDPNYAYELLIDGNRLTAMWTGKDFVTLENLQGFVKRNGLAEDAKAWLEKCRNEGEPITIRIPGSYGSKAANWGQANIDEVKTDEINYSPAMAILTEPRTFMYLVPAQKALKVVNNIKSRYEEKMGQVRGRLPIHLGIVYANRYTPLRAVLDAGRRMLSQKPETVIGELICGPREDGTPYLSWQTKENNTRVCWPVALNTFGDPCIEDKWYPYLAVLKLVRREKQDALKLDQPAEVYYNDSVKEVDRMIHVRDLVAGDQVLVYPSTFDFEYLDSAGVRFEIAYEKRNRKSPDKAHRPYFLEQIDELNEIWNVLGAGGLNRNQVYALRDAIASKRQEWKSSDNSASETFKQFCRDMLVIASWNKVQLPGQNEKKYPWEDPEKDHEKFFDQWADYAVRSWFDDVIQLHLQIMKDEIGKKEED